MEVRTLSTFSGIAFKSWRNPLQSGFSIEDIILSQSRAQDYDFP